MAAWGGVGVFGALLARLFGRNLGRWSLAGACALAGLAYGAFLDLHLWVMYSGEHSMSEYLVMAGRGLPFNLGHAAGNVVFCLAFGPLLVRALQRYRDRLDVTWKPLPAGGAGAGTAAAAVAALLIVIGALAAPAPAQAADRHSARAATYLVKAQNADGGFGAGPRRSSTQLHTSWAVIGLAAAGRNPNRVRRNGRSPVDYIVRGIGSVRALADLERTILALRAAGRSAHSVRGRNLVRELIGKRRRNGSFAGLANQTAFAILALRAAGRSRNDRTVRTAARWLINQHNRDGGYNFAGKGGRSGVDDTAAAVQALVAAGKRSSKTVRRAASFLASKQNADGGMPLAPGQASNAQSTAWAIQALKAAGRSPGRLHRRGARSPIEYLRSLQTSNGAVRYSRSSSQTPVWVTAQAVTGLAAKPFPVRR